MWNVTEDHHTEQPAIQSVDIKFVKALNSEEEAVLFGPLVLGSPMDFLEETRLMNAMAGQCLALITATRT